MSADATQAAHADLLRRPYEPSDAPALAELINLIEVHGGGRAIHSADELHRLIVGLVRTPSTDSTLLFEPGGRLIAAGFTTTPPEKGSQLYLTGGVQPDWHGRGIGRSLVEHHLDRARQIHETLANGATWRVMVHNQFGDRRAARLLGRFGFEPVRYWFEMRAPSTTATLVDPPDGVTLVPYTADHEDAVYRTHMETFVDAWGFQRRNQPSWRELTVGRDTFRPDLSFVAHASDIVGFVLTHVRPTNRVYTAQMGVVASYRRRGLGAALLTRVLNAAARAGYDSVELDVDASSPTGAVGVYERVGFKPKSQVVTHALTLGP